MKYVVLGTGEHQDLPDLTVKEPFLKQNQVCLASKYFSFYHIIHSTNSSVTLHHTEMNTRDELGKQELTVCMKAQVCHMLLTRCQREGWS